MYFVRDSLLNTFHWSARRFIRNFITCTLSDDDVGLGVLVASIIVLENRFQGQGPPAWRSMTTKPQCLVGQGGAYKNVCTFKI